MDLKQAVSSSNTQVVIIDFNHFPEPIEETLSICKTLNSFAPRITILKDFEKNTVMDLVNRFEIHKALLSSSLEDLSDFTLEALNVFRKKYLEKNLYAEVKQQNRLLEEFTLGLEKIIEERTQDIEKSKKAVEKHVLLIRALNRFTTELSSLSSVEEILILLRREFKKFHKMSPPILAVNAKTDTPKLFYFHGLNIHTHALKGEWPELKTIRRGEQADQQLLANEIGRPLGTVLSVPLESEHGNYVVFIENQLSEAEISEFYAFLGDRLTALEMTLERIVLDQEIYSANVMWESTFNGVSDPLAVINEEYNLVRKNKFFSDNKEKCYEGLGQSRPCDGCPLLLSKKSRKPESSKISIGDKKYHVYVFPVESEGLEDTQYVNYYLDITKSEMLQGQVIQNEKMAAVGNLADHIAHELNNPLTGIHSLSQVLIKETVNENQLNQDLIEVEKAALRCQNIINNLLDFSKEQTEERRSSVDLKEVIEKTMPFLKSVMGQFERSIDLSDDINVYVDPQLIQQVVFNLINNACQAMGEKGVLKIKCTVEGELALFSVQDSGPGVPKDILDQVFEPFFTTKPQGEGTGLGLSVCKNIIESYGGELYVVSLEGRGAEFGFKLPIYKES